MPPNSALTELLSVVGEANTREIVRTFLYEAPRLLQTLIEGDRAHRHRAAHSLKSSARLVGADAVSVRAAQLESVLAAPEGDVSSAEIDALKSDLALVSSTLAEFASTR